MLKDLLSVFGIKMERCSAVNGEIYSSRYENGTKPIPLEKIDYIHLIAARVHGVKSRKLMFRTEDDLLADKDGIYFDDYSFKGFVDMVQGAADIFDIPDHIIKSFLSYETEVTLIHCANGNVTNICTD